MNPGTSTQTHVERLSREICMCVSPACGATPREREREREVGRERGRERERESRENDPDTEVLGC